MEVLGKSLIAVMGSPSVSAGVLPTSVEFWVWRGGITIQGGQFEYTVKYWDFKLNIKERLELTPMGSFDVGQGGINSGPGSYGVPEGEQTNGPGFSLCAAPLELLGPVFQDGRDDRMNERRSGVYQTRVSGGVTMRGGVERVILMASSNYGTGCRRVT